MANLTSKNGIYCYDGPPISILPPELQEIVKKMPETRMGLVNVRITFYDGKYCDTAVAYDRLVELPHPYCCLDIKMIQRLVTR